MIRNASAVAHGLPAAVVALAAAAAMAASPLVPAPDAGAPARGLGTVLGGDADGFALALEPRAFDFPRDHGPHAGYRTEWWYLTGHLHGPAGEPFGMQVTFFRFALAPRAAASGSAWRARDVYMAHLAVTDVERGAFHSDERFARAALGLAGARGEPLAVWLEDWHLAAADGGGWPWQVEARADGFGVTLSLGPGKGAFANGERGLSRKSDEPGNASYYYSMPRMAAAGTVHTPHGDWPVTGTAWLDREWSTSALAPEQAGWDWFALQLADGREVMYYQLRGRDGQPDPASAGMFYAAGAGTPLVAGDVRVEVLAQWRSPATGRRYPSRWRLSVAGLATDLVLEPKLAAQEHRGVFRYWEGAVHVRDPHGRELGHGYVELTGY